LTGRRAADVGTAPGGNQPSTADVIIALSFDLISRKLGAATADDHGVALGPQAQGQAEADARCGCQPSSSLIARIARALLAEGVSVTVNGRAEGRVAEAVADLSAELPGAAVSGVAADFSNPEHVERLAAAIGIAPGDMLHYWVTKAGILALANGRSLLQRFIEPAELANLATFLASPLPSARNGAALHADGGVLTAMI
jgi:NAD(P)-dependent dehydrogenase (short-subunit alcohol dehydrogenase family)